MSRNLQYRSLTFAFVICSALLLNACQKQQGGPPGGMPAAEVTVLSVQAQNVPLSFEYTAQTTGSREIEVRARVTGIIEKRNYREGALVKPGQSLFTLDQAPFQTALARAQAELTGAEAKRAQAERNVTRLKPLHEAKAVSQKEYDDALSTAEVSLAELKAAQARVNEARLNLEYTKVESPISGVSSRALRSEGSLVSGPDVLLTTITQLDPMYVSFGIPDSEHLKWRRDVEVGKMTLPQDGRFDVSVKLEDGTTYSKQGKLNFSDVRINSSTGTSEARAELPNSELKLRSGQFVRVMLNGAARNNAILVPQRAVLDGPQGKFVYLVGADSKAEPRPIEVGDWHGDQWIINNGLKPGDQVIIDGIAKIFMPGTPVKIADPSAKPVTPEEKSSKK